LLKPTQLRWFFRFGKCVTENLVFLPLFFDPGKSRQVPFSITQLRKALYRSRNYSKKRILTGEPPTVN
jgi:hypothetical protein